MKMNSSKRIVPPRVLLEKTQQLLSEMLKDKKVSIENIEKYYKVESKLRLADKRCKVSLNDVFARMIGSQQNRSMMPNVIKYWDYQNTLFDKVLKHHDPQEVLDTYNSAEDLYHAILNEWPKDAKPLDKEMKGLWAQWCKAVLSAAKFIVQFKDIEALREAFGALYNNTWARAALPALLAMEVQGLQFTLACDFLKECGYDYPKPDVHLTDVFREVCDVEDSFAVYRKIIEYAAELNMTAYKLDKMIWLVCSGNFYLDKQKCPDKKEKLLKALREYRQ